MKVTYIKCENCGAQINIKKNDADNICPYCGSVILIENEKAEEIKSKTSNKEFYSSPVSPISPAQDYIPPRPKLNRFLFILLLLFYVWPGIMYLYITKVRQKQWDDLYANGYTSTDNNNIYRNRNK